MPLTVLSLSPSAVALCCGVGCTLNWSMNAIVSPQNRVYLCRELVKLLATDELRPVNLDGYIGEWPEPLASSERNGISDFRLTVQPEHAVLSFESATSPAEGVGMLLGLLTR